MRPTGYEMRECEQFRQAELEEMERDFQSHQNEGDGCEERVSMVKTFKNRISSEKQKNKSCS